MLQDQDIKKYQALYEKRYGRAIGREQAYSQLNSLVIMMHRVYRPLKKSDVEAPHINTKTRKTF